MWQKIKLKHKWRIGREKVIKRYEKIMQNFPQLPICAACENFELYTQRVANHLLFTCRGRRLNQIVIRYYEKELKYFELSFRRSCLIIAFGIAL